MKHSFTAACIAAASIVLFSCDWFSSNKQEPSNPLIGQWKVDSIKAGRDSGMGEFIAFLAVKDSQGLELEFKKDTVVSITGGIRDTSFYKWDEKESKVISKDSTENFSYAKLNDSSVSLTSKDNMILFLQKK